LEKRGVKAAKEQNNLGKWNQHGVKEYIGVIGQ
jgi:hypothetical protein